MLLYCADAYSRESTAMNALFELFKCNKPLLFEEIEVTMLSLKFMMITFNLILTLHRMMTYKNF